MSSRRIRRLVRVVGFCTIAVDDPAPLPEPVVSNVIDIDVPGREVAAGHRRARADGSIQVSAVVILVVNRLAVGVNDRTKPVEAVVRVLRHVLGWRLALPRRLGRRSRVVEPAARVANPVTFAVLIVPHRVQPPPRLDGIAKRTVGTLLHRPVPSTIWVMRPAPFSGAPGSP